MELFAGISIRKDSSKGKAKSLRQDELMDEQILSTKMVAERQKLIEEYLSSRMDTFWNQANFVVSPARMLSTARSFFNLFENAEEGREKDKKQNPMLLPILIGIKLKLAAFFASTYLAIAVIAKKAILAGLISLLVSGFITVKNVVEQQQQKHVAGKTTGAVGSFIPPPSMSYHQSNDERASGGGSGGATAWEPVALASAQAPIWQSAATAAGGGGNGNGRLHVNHFNEQAPAVALARIQNNIKGYEEQQNNE